jgi:hypothetical protein
MISLENILNIICTEAFEHDGVPEVPDHKHGAPQNYAAQKRDARGEIEDQERSPSAPPDSLQYDLELVQERDGTLQWLE